jgi:hypothetical protein
MTTQLDQAQEFVDTVKSGAENNNMDEVSRQANEMLGAMTPNQVAWATTEMERLGVLPELVVSEFSDPEDFYEMAGDDGQMHVQDLERVIEDEDTKPLTRLAAQYTLDMMHGRMDFNASVQPQITEELSQVMEDRSQYLQAAMLFDGISLNLGTPGTLDKGKAEAALADENSTLTAEQKQSLQFIMNDWDRFNGRELWGDGNPVTAETFNAEAGNYALDQKSMEERANDRAAQNLLAGDLSLLPSTVEAAVQPPTEDAEVLPPSGDAPVNPPVDPPVLPSDELPTESQTGTADQPSTTGESVVPSWAVEITPFVPPSEFGQLDTSDMTPQQVLESADTTIEQKLGAVEALYVSGVRNFTLNDNGETLEVSVNMETVRGNRDILTLMAKDENGRARPVLRGIDENDGTYSQQGEAGYIGDWWTNHKPNSVFNAGT